MAKKKQKNKDQEVTKVEVIQPEKSVEDIQPEKQPSDLNQKIKEIFSKINSDVLFINEESGKYFTNERQAKRSLKDYKTVKRADFQA